MGLTESKPIQEEVQEKLLETESTSDKESSWEVVGSEETSDSMPELEPIQSISLEKAIEEVAEEIVVGVTEKVIEEIAEEQKEKELREVVEKFVDDILRDCVKKANELNEARESEEMSAEDDNVYSAGLSKYFEMMDEFPSKNIKTKVIRKSQLDIIDEIEESFTSEDSESEISGYDDYIEEMALESEEQDNACYDLLETIENASVGVNNFLERWIKMGELKNFLKFTLLVYIGSTFCNTTM